MSSARRLPSRPPLRSRNPFRRRRHRFSEPPQERGFLRRSRSDLDGFAGAASHRDRNIILDELKAYEEEVDIPIRKRDEPIFRRRTPVKTEYQGWEYLDQLQNNNRKPRSMSIGFSAIWNELDFALDYDHLGENGFMYIDHHGLIRINPEQSTHINTWMFYTVHLAFHHALGFYQPPADYPHPELWRLAAEMIINSKTAGIDRLPLPQNFPNYRAPRSSRFSFIHKPFDNMKEKPSPEKLVDKWLRSRRKVSNDTWHSPAGHLQWDVVGTPDAGLSKRYWALETLTQLKKLKPIVNYENLYADHGKIARAYRWVEDYFPLLSACTAEFELDYDHAEAYNVAIGAVAAEEHIIFVNPDAPISELEWRWVLVHEILHVVLEHHQRKGERDHMLWNVACDYVINNWLEQMGVGMRPEGVLFNPKYKGRDAESIYDELLENGGDEQVQLINLRGEGGKGDILDFDDDVQNSRRGKKRQRSRFRPTVKQLAQKAAKQIMEGEHPGGMGRDDLPGDLIEQLDLSKTAFEEIQVPDWEVDLADWMHFQLSPRTPERSYSKRNRRQSAVPHIPLAGRALRRLDSPTFGVILDTSGSMSSFLLQKGLAAVVRFAQHHGVSQVRLVMCDTRPYDEGFIPLEKLQKPFRVYGRGGTVLQPSVNFLEEAHDFPDDAPFLIVTDGQIEDNLYVYREHAYMLPGNAKLPFEPAGPVFNVLGESRRGFGRR